MNPTPLTLIFLFKTLFVPLSQAGRSSRGVHWNEIKRVSWDEIALHPGSATSETPQCQPKVFPYGVCSSSQWFPHDLSAEGGCNPDLWIRRGTRLLLNGTTPVRVYGWPICPCGLIENSIGSSVMDEGSFSEKIVLISVVSLGFAIIIGLIFLLLYKLRRSD